MARAFDLATSRRRSALPGSTYDRLVTVLKVVLPLAALAILLMIVIWPLTASQEFSFILSKDRVATSRERLRLDRAVYRGEDRRGQPFVITADRAVQRTSATPVVELRGIRAEIQTRDGPAKVVADAGRYDLEAERLKIDGPVHFTSAAGYALSTRDVTVDLPTRTAVSGDAVDGRLPLGTFRAGRLRADVNGRTVVLDRGARLRIVQR